MGCLTVLFGFVTMLMGFILVGMYGLAGDQECLITGLVTAFLGYVSIEGA